MAITPFEKDIEIIQKLDDEPNDVQGLTPEELKKRFDQAAIWLKEYINGTLIPAITGDGGTGGASNIGAAVDDFPGETVQEVLDAFNDALTDRYTKSETNSYVGQETENLVETVHVDLTTGVITVTKKDGSKETFDTALEKVPATMALVDEESGTYLVITNVDGSQTKTDVSKLIDTYTFQNSAEVAFSVDGSGNNKTVTASIRPASIGLDRFTLEVTQKLEQYNATSKANADAAAASAKAAKASETNAKGSETAASGSASQSAQSAGAASGSASQAAQSAGAAAASAESAQSNAAQALAAKNAAEASATLSQSWTEGGTGIREGENTNNAKYWAGVAQGAAGGGVTTFNGRSGAVVPAEGDYTAEMVGARPESWIPSAADTGAVPITEKGAPNGVATLGPDGKVPAGQLPKMDYDPAGSAEAVQQALTAHTGNKNNPHAVTAEQVGASRAVKGTYPIASGQSIQAGDVVDVVEGKVQKSAMPVENVKTVFDNGAATLGTSVLRLSDNLNVVCYLYQNGSTYWPCVHLIDDTGKVVGQTNRQVIENVHASNIMAARLSDTQFVVGFASSQNVFLSVGTVSGESINLGSRYTLMALQSGWNCDICIVPFSENQAFVVTCNGSNNYPSGSILSISGSTITKGAWTHPDGVGRPGVMSAARLPDSDGKKRVCVCFNDVNDGNKGKAVIATIDSSNVVTWGSVVTIVPSDVNGTSCASVGSVIYVVFHTIVYILNDNLSVLGQEKYDTNTYSDTRLTLTSFDNFAVGTYFGKNNTDAAVIRWDGEKVSISEPYSFSPVGYANYISTARISNDRMIVAYQSAGSGNYGTTTILTVSGNQIAGSFIDGSQDAIALKSGTAEQSIEVVYSGTVAADWVTEGQVISSPGVYGAGALDGVLQVWSKDRPVGTKIVTGSYIGTGTYGEGNPNSITFDFTPILFWVVKYRVEGTTYFSQEMSESPMIYTPILSENYTEGGGFYDDAAASRSYAKVADNGKTIIWYHKENANKQLNSSGYAYYYLAIG